MESVAPYVLFKRPVSLDTLAMVQYLHWCGVDARPRAVYERNYPAGVDAPAIRDDRSTVVHQGLDACATHLVRASRYPGDGPALLAAARAFKAARPAYRIADGCGGAGESRT
jgi:hypothetical protein